MRTKEPIIVLSKNAKTTPSIVKKTSDVPSLEYDYLFKFSVVGDAGVGKSCLLGRYAEDIFLESYIRNLGIDSVVKTLEVGEKTVRTQVWDVHRQVQTTLHTENYRAGSQAIIVAFDLTDKNSFNNAKTLVDHYNTNGVNAKIVLVGTKSDLAHKRVVEHKEIQEFINSTNKVDAYIETSAKTGENVERVFETAATLVLNDIAPTNKSENSSAKPSTRDLLIERLEQYINKIDKHKDPNAKAKPDFSHGFWHHKESRAANREANYYLAKQLLDKLNNSPDPISTIFDDLNGQRDSLIKTKNIDSRRYYINRGINSRDLNKIIDIARKSEPETQISSKI